MIAYPPALQAVGGARTGVAPVNLLDVLDVNGNLYYWSDRRCTAPILITGGVLPSQLTPPVALAAGQALAWAFPTDDSSTGSNNSGVASASGSSGQMGLAFQGPFTSGVSVTFAGFEPPPLPAGAVIDALYLVALMSPLPTHYSDHGAFSIGDLASIPNQVSAQIFPSTLATVEALAPAFSIQNTAAPAPGDEVDGSALLGYDVESWQIFEIGVAIYYQVPGGRIISEPFVPGVAPGTGVYEPWLLSIPALTFHRSSVTDVGNFVLQNLSGDTLSRDFEKIMRSSALEGAFFVYRCFQADAAAPWIEVHGTLTVDDVGVDTVTLKGQPAINPGDTDTPTMEYCETCQWRWRSPQCGATGDTECEYSFQTCQVLERILVSLNDYEKNYGETTANVPTQVTNRQRRF